jgi:hypothetical protein
MGTVFCWSATCQVAQQTELAADDHLGLIYFVPFIPHHLCGSSAQGWFIRTLRNRTVPANHFFASFDSNGPLRVLRVPGDFHSFYPHDIILQSPLCIIAPSTTTNLFKALFLMPAIAWRLSFQAPRSTCRSSIALSHGLD